MKDSFFIDWQRENNPPLLATGCKSAIEAAQWALEHDYPLWARDDTQLVIWQGRPGEGERFEFVVGELGGKR